MRHGGTVATLCTALAISLGGCFTGIESTPRITAGDVRKHNASAAPATTDSLLAAALPQPPAMWQRGKGWYVTDNRISRLFADAHGAADSLAGSILRLDAIRAATSLTGYTVTDISFVTGSGATLHYRIDTPPARLLAGQGIGIPFTVEASVVSAADSLLRGRRLYITTPAWLDTGGHGRRGLRHVPVQVLGVRPGDSVYPLAVLFRPGTADSDTAMVLVNAPGDRAATRPCDRMFSAVNPRLRWPHITDATWQLITRSQVAAGMTPDECRLALGAPAHIDKYPTHAGMAERWTYGDGVYLLFDDGLLSSFRL